MNKKRILAIIGIVILLGLYIATFISAFFVTEVSAAFFKASVFCTIAVPLLLYSYLLVCRVFRKKDDKEQQ